METAQFQQGKATFHSLDPGSSAVQLYPIKQPVQRLSRTMQTLWFSSGKVKPGLVVSHVTGVLPSGPVLPFCFMAYTLFLVTSRLGLY